MKPILEFLLVGAGGAIGAASRYGIGLLSGRYFSGEFPIGTLLANLVGCFLIGILIGSGRDQADDKVRLMFGVGFLGALTTFSTFGAETIQHATKGNWAIAGASVGCNLIVGLAAVVIGIWIGKKWSV